MSPRGVWAVMRESFWVLLISIVVLFVFLLAMGAYSPGQVAGLTLVMVALFVLWVAHAAWVARRADKRDPRAIAARERRGF
jgi:TRAP-type uncharacterized transport system fused permease subunit